MVAVNVDMFLYLGIIVTIAALAAFLLKLIRQPPILAYVLTGIFLPALFSIISDVSIGEGIVESMSIIGIAFLLFIVGMEIELKKLKNVALVANVGGSISIVILFVFGYLIALLMGFLTIEAAYLGLMMAFSSTMVVLKLLSDKRELNTLHGRIVVGMLLLQDVVAIFALSILGSLNSFSAVLFSYALLKFLLLFAVAYLCSKYLFPHVFRFAARNHELLLITSLAVCFVFSLAFHFLGFSIAIGAFIAGLTLGNLDYSFEIIGKVKSLRDFFSLLFFVSLGMGISFSVLKDIIWPIVVFTVFVIVFKPLVILLICSMFQFTKKPSFFSSVALANIGEFSLIIASMGFYELGHISPELFSLIVIVTLASITITSYTIKYSPGIYRIFEKPLSIFDKFTTEGLEYTPTEVKPTIVLCGYDRIGFSILKNLHKSKKRVLIIDYNPEIISKLVKENYHCIYGEVNDDEIIDRMHLKQIKMLISTVPDYDDNVFLIKQVRAVNKKAKLIVTASRVDEALKCYNLGADYVILPHFLGGEHVATMITDVRARRIKLKETRLEHIKHLEERSDLGHEHPS